MSLSSTVQLSSRSQPTRCREDIYGQHECGLQHLRSAQPLGLNTLNFRSLRSLDSQKLRFCLPVSLTVRALSGHLRDKESAVENELRIN